MTALTERAFSCVCVYTFLMKEDKVLLLLRKNTGYHDGDYGLVAGHVEKGESAKEGMVREAYEEVGVHIHPDDLKIRHVMHRVSNRVNLDIFFECTRWKGEPINNEPHKCEKVEFFPIHQPPSNLIPYVRDAFKAIEQGVLYSELGWGQR